jgi:hypothetical protein
MTNKLLCEECNKPLKVMAICQCGKKMCPKHFLERKHDHYVAPPEIREMMERYGGSD